MRVVHADTLPEGSAAVARRFLRAIDEDPSIDRLDEQFTSRGELYLEDKSRFNRTLMYEKELKIEDFRSSYWQTRVLAH